MPPSDLDISRKSHFSRDVLTLVTGTTISQIITILATPFITRLYGPEAFGLLAIFTSITSLISVIVCLRYELAIMLPKSDEEAANVFGLCILSTVAVSILLIPILYFSHQLLETTLNSSQIGDYLWVVPPLIFLSGTFLALNYWNTRTKQFHRLAIAQVMRSVSSTGTQIGFGLNGYATGGILIGATLIGQLVSTFVLGIQIMRDHVSFFRQYITTKDIILVLKRYSNFPKYDIWAALLNTFSGMLPVFILAAYFNPTTVGYYALGLMVLQFPLSFIQGAISQVFFQKAAEAKNISHQKLKAVVGQTIKPLIFLAFFPAILFILIGPEIFSVIFGAQWEESGTYVRFLSLWIGICFVSSPISTLFSIFQKQQFSLIFNALQLISRIVALIIGAMIGSALIAIIFFSIVGFISNTVAYFYLLRLSGISILVPARIVVNFFLLSIPIILCILLFQRLFSSNNLTIVFFSILISLIFPVLIIKRDSEISGILKSVIAQMPVINKLTKYLH
jgi:O-antigen/teichoic acid export membrane protein